MLTLSTLQLYAALYEWRTGVRQAMGFTANAFLDVYQGHMNTFDHVRAKRGNAFHVMMEDIYSRARRVTKAFIMVVTNQLILRQ
jgi:hypothetical protein